MKQFKEYKELNIVKVAEVVLQRWKRNDIFFKSIANRKGCPRFVFYEGPPSANGLPGIHHVMARTIKDIFCRYKTQKGFLVERKAGWDTHGLPVELAVEKELKITKEDIGQKISIAEYNQKCREAVMRYTSEWEALTEKIGYWVDMKNPYVTYDNKYIESVWWLLKNLYDKQLLYKGYSIQPYSPKAGTGLSSHELNLPGCYRDVKDQTLTAQFKIIKSSKSDFLFLDINGNILNEELYFLAWTTTPWTLPSNTALAVGPKIKYIRVKTINRFSKKTNIVILAENLLPKYFSDNVWLDKEQSWDEEAAKYLNGLRNEPPATKLILPPLKDVNYNDTVDKKIQDQLDPCFCIIGSRLVGIRYEQLLPFAQPMNHPEEAFRVIAGDFVTTEEGTGIVHIAPTFGEDDMKVAIENGVPPMLVPDENNNPTPLVERQGRFVKQMGRYAGKYVKNEYYLNGEAPEKSVDVELMIQLVEEGKCFSKEKYEHSYPHCWRTDKPILYYPLDSWFIKSSAVRKRMMELNRTINWKPGSIGCGRFEEWLKNLHDWNLSRSRYWGIPLPIWRTEDGKEEICIGSIEELKDECEKSVKAGFMSQNPLKDFLLNDFSRENYLSFDLHRPNVDEIILVSPAGKPMNRESDLIDVWFDSGSMPYGQFHYPFENTDLIDGKKVFPADFIAEGVDQTRGWFFTLHAIASMCFDSVAYKNVISNGLVVDKSGQKMSKRLGNTVNPFDILEKHGADAIRWYMITNAQPWDNLKFDKDGISEVINKFFRALFNTYAFFALYANVDGFSLNEPETPLAKQSELDRWIISKLNSLIRNVEKSYDAYEPTQAGRIIQNFVVNDLSNWYVRLSRKRFWRGDYSRDKIDAYQTLHKCLYIVTQLAAPIAPFYSDQLFLDLQMLNPEDCSASVHLSKFPVADDEQIDHEMEEKMALAQLITSLTLSLRKKTQIKVRQPLHILQILLPKKEQREYVEDVKSLILSEVNIKELACYTYGTPGKFTYQIKPNFKTLGPKFERQMKALAGIISCFNQNDILSLLLNKKISVELNDEKIDLDIEDFEISTCEISGWESASENGITVAIDTNISADLKAEGIARELVNKIQNYRKDKDLQVTDRIKLLIEKQDDIIEAVKKNLNYICSETLTEKFEIVETLKKEDSITVDINADLSTAISISKMK